MSAYHFTPAAAYTLDQVAAFHSESFAGYFVPMEKTGAAMASFCRVFQIDLQRCVVMHDDQGAFVGLAKLALRDNRAWCGGFGIAPAFRGRGAGMRLIERMIESAGEAGATSLTLEVLTQNEPAIKLYTHAGFVTTHRVVVLEIAAAELPLATSTSDVEEISVESCLAWLGEQPRPIWTREISSILALKTAALSMRAPAGENALIYTRLPNAISIQATQLQSPDDADLAALLRAAAGDASMIFLRNEPEQSQLALACKRLGFHESFGQLAMQLAL